jgi:hypothetical protein
MRTLPASEANAKPWEHEGFEMNDQPDRKPDGSAYTAHLARITERNVAAKKAGKERRTKRELAQAKQRMESERLQEAGLRATEH